MWALDMKKRKQIVLMKRGKARSDIVSVLSLNQLTQRKQKMKGMLTKFYSFVRSLS